MEVTEDDFEAEAALSWNQVPGDITGPPRFPRGYKFRDPRVLRLGVNSHIAVMHIDPYTKINHLLGL